MINYDLKLNRHFKPQNKTAFGHFLAGLIDADGHINKQGGIEISFNARDLSVALYIQRLLGGNLYKYKKVNAYAYSLRGKANLGLAHNLILNKLRYPDKLHQFNTRLAPGIIGDLSGYGVGFDNHWFAGFVQGDGSFQIKIRKPHKRFAKHQIEVVLQFEQKQLCLLKQIQTEFGGSIGYRGTRDTYIYSSVNLNNASKLVRYFDVYQVNGSSYRIYLIWKQVLNLVLNKAHLNNSGLTQILNLKQAMSNLKTKA